MKFYLQLVILTFVLFVPLALMKYGLDLYSQGNTIWFSLAFFTLLTIVSYQYTMSANKLKNSKFVTRFFVTTGIRIILCAIFLAIYLIISENRDKVFVVTFMILYLFYTMFEIYHLVTKLRPEKNSQVDSSNH